MAQSFPYTYYSCSCVENAPSASIAKRTSLGEAQEEDDEEATFDPHSPRASYCLFPLEHLLYCDECHQIRCPRCIIEEPLIWYCPSCLFEIPTTTVKSESVRCTRNCYNCPICTASMTVQTLEQPSGSTNNDGQDAQPSSSYFLACPYCNWTSLDIGIKFDKPNNITGQLAKLKNGAEMAPSSGSRGTMSERRMERVEEEGAEERTQDGQSQKQETAEERFASLSAFYKSQMPSGSSYGYDLGVGSPSSLARIMNMYTGTKRLRREKPEIAREARNLEEGLKVFDPAEDERVVQEIAKLGWDGTTTQEQRTQQLGLTKPRFLSELRPVPTLIRTKRSKRCRACRHILVRPEAKIQSTRYKIRLLALNYIPKVTLAPLSTTPALGNAAQGAASGTGPSSIPSFSYESLKPHKPVQFLLTLCNPLYDPIRVTLATPTTTPGKVSSRVTVLCPEFDIGANTDVWDEALNAPSATQEKRRPGSVGAAGSSTGTTTHTGQAEAGKIWERGRNWTTVILEVTPGSLPVRLPREKPRSFAVPGALQSLAEALQADEEDQEVEEELDEDDALLEIPVFVRFEYETEPAEEGVSNLADKSEDHGTGGKKERREGAFWCVLGVGKIAS